MERSTDRLEDAVAKQNSRSVRSSKSMSRKRKAAIASIVVIAAIGLTFPFRTIETRQFSAYAACRNMAAKTRGYGPWQHKQTSQTLLAAEVSFSDGFNTLLCTTIGIGPLWIALWSEQTAVGCIVPSTLQNTRPKSCPIDYFGVNP